MYSHLPEVLLTYWNILTSNNNSSSQENNKHDVASPTPLLACLLSDHCNTKILNVKRNIMNSILQNISIGK